MKITDEECEAAYELTFIVKDILTEHQRARLYVEIYAHQIRCGNDSVYAATLAKIAILDMERAFNECPTCAQESLNESKSHTKAN